MTRQWTDTVSGPSTAVAVFCYGGLYQQTAACLMRDLCLASDNAGFLRAQEQLERALAEQAPGLKMNVGCRSIWPVQLHLPTQDALIDRSRAVTAKAFLESDSEVLIMVDHDIDWVGADDSYEGDLLHLARKCAETRGIVGGLVCKKTRGQGPAVIWEDDGEWSIGDDKLVKVFAMGAAFTAYHRDVLQAVTDNIQRFIPSLRKKEIAPGFTPIFLPGITPHPHNDKEDLHQSEDWMLSMRARELGFQSWAAMRPFTRHWGLYGYEVSRDGEDRPRPKIACLHATRGRPEMAERTMERWKARSSGLCEIEYIFARDDDDETMASFAPWNCMVVTSHNRGNVDAYNSAAYVSKSDILVQVHDDVEPPKNWDWEISRRLGPPDKPRVLRTSDGLPESVNGKPWLVPVMICTRAWAKKLGGIWYPGYVSVFCDDDASLKAGQDGVVVDAPDLEFKHAWGGPASDATYARSYRPENWELGEKLLERRKSAGFPDCPELWRGQ